MGDKTKATAAGSTGCSSCHCCCRDSCSTITEIKQPDRKQKQGDGFLRVPEFAELIGLPEAAVRELIKSQRLTINKVGRSVYIPRTEATRIKRESLRPATRPLAHTRFLL